MKRVTLCRNFKLEVYIDGQNFKTKKKKTQIIEEEKARYLQPDMEANTRRIVESHTILFFFISVLFFEYLPTDTKIQFNLDIL